MSVYLDPIEKWEKTVEVDGVTEKKTVARVENGFIIIKGRSGHTGEGKEKEYFEESKAFISETNPFEDEDMSLGIKSLLDNI